MIDIWAYIARESAPSLADAFPARIYGAIEIIVYAPHIGRERPEFEDNPRSIAVRPYVVFYQPLPEGGGILVRGVIPGTRDLSRHLSRAALAVFLLPSSRQSR